MNYLYNITAWIDLKHDRRHKTASVNRWLKGYSPVAYVTNGYTTIYVSKIKQRQPGVGDTPL